MDDRGGHRVSQLASYERVHRMHMARISQVDSSEHLVGIRASDAVPSGHATGGGAQRCVDTLTTSKSLAVWLRRAGVCPRTVEETELSPMHMPRAAS